MAPGAEGVNRARSATEAFLYRRLETLPGTARRFRLNVELPIPFDGWGKMEVDLLCAETHMETVAPLPWKSHDSPASMPMTSPGEGVSGRRHDDWTWRVYC